MEAQCVTPCALRSTSVPSQMSKVKRGNAWARMPISSTASSRSLYVIRLIGGRSSPSQRLSTYSIRKPP
uniref:Uncharacterized protein n=1 Tax=uncultured marine virus TaxID=186617 RepID=A0A0F7L5N3_9VIRU|nr:hypothetical protein [uncultured marine virus]